VDKQYAYLVFFFLMPLGSPFFLLLLPSFLGAGAATPPAETAAPIDDIDENEHQRKKQRATSKKM